MAKQGVWGGNSKIITPIQYKRVTCATCMNYCREDHSCLVSSIIPKINGYDYWKTCKLFRMLEFLYLLYRIYCMIDIYCFILFKMPIRIPASRRDIMCVNAYCYVYYWLYYGSGAYGFLYLAPVTVIET